jgi:hypothetical protein
MVHAQACLGPADEVFCFQTPKLSGGLAKKQITAAIRPKRGEAGLFSDSKN